LKDSAKPEPWELARIEALRVLCQGPPLLWESAGVEVPQETLNLFHAEDTEDFRRLVRKALALMLEGPYKDAIDSALGSRYIEDTLTQRRNAFLQGSDISYRTLIRHEQEGAKRLAHLMVNIGLEEPSTPRESIDELLVRIRDLEVVVRGLTELSTALIEQSARGRLDAQVLKDALATSRHSDGLAERLYFKAQTYVGIRANEFEDHMREQADD
jgi:hypothetical protein